jgi:hypothetical protein
MRSTCAALAMVLLIASSARAEVESEQVKEGVAAYDALEFGRAIEILEKAVGESLTREERLVAYRTIAFANCALDRPEPARAAFTRMLRIDPAAELDKSVAPKVRALFEEARAQVATGHAEPVESASLPSLSVTTQPAKPKEGTPISFTASAPGGLGRSATLFHRVRGQPYYSEVKADGRDGSFALTLPGSDVHAPGIEYYLVVFDERAVAIARTGGISQPLSLAVAGREKPTHKRAWVWGVVGGVLVAGAVLGAVLGTQLKSPDPKSPADVQLIAPR